MATRNDAETNKTRTNKKTCKPYNARTTKYTSQLSSPSPPAPRLAPYVPVPVTIEKRCLLDDHGPEGQVSQPRRYPLASDRQQARP